MINLQNIANKQTIIKEFYTWLFNDSRISSKIINLESETDLSLAPYYMDSNIYFPKPFFDFFQTKAMKRLGRVSQLSLVANEHPVYQTRLEHSKGAYNRALEEMIYNFQNLNWKNFIEKNNLKLYVIANLFKVAGHDIGHLPLSHALEEAIYNSHNAHEVLGKRIMLENEEIQSILTSISSELPQILGELYEKDILNFNTHSEGSYDVDRIDYLSRDTLYLGVPKNIETYPYQTVQVKSDSLRNILVENDNSITKSNAGNTFIDVYDYESLQGIEDLLALRFSLYQNIYMSKNIKMYESAIETFLDAYLAIDSECGEYLKSFILKLQNSDIYTCDLSDFLEWDDITFYSQIIEIAEKHKNSNIRDLASMIIPNMESFLNMIYCHFDIKNTKSFSPEDMAFLKKIKHLIKSNGQFAKNLRNPNFVEENTLFSTKDISLSSQLDSNLVSCFPFNLRAYKKKEPIYLRDKSGKIYELSKHPDRRCNWDEQKILLQFEYCYIPFLRFKGFSETEINELRSMFSPLNSESLHSDILEKKTVNMNPLKVENNIEDYFLEI